ncbi:hypothetical protein ABDK00_014140 [Niabella insulamsoli]|uniref:hypothetical protein n=1 Tax=Niabella insulamsoli TaxID=3144874 RepID=UPI0031FD4561
MIKTKLIEGRVTMLAADLPEGASNVKVANHFDGLALTWDVETMKIGSIELPEGNWQPLGFLRDISEEKARKIASSTHFSGLRRYHKPGNILTVKEYYSTALKFIHSLIESEVQTVNPLGNKPYYSLSNYGASPDGFKKFESDIEAWLAAEAQTWKNIFLMIKM